MQEELSRGTVSDILNVAQELEGIALGLKFDFFIKPETRDVQIERLRSNSAELKSISDYLIGQMNLMIDRNKGDK